MFKSDPDIQKLAESRSQVDLDAIADDAISQSDEDENKYETFEAGYNLGKSAGTKDVWEVLFSPEDASMKTSYFFIGAKSEILERLKKLPALVEEAKADDEEINVVDEELEEIKKMEGA